MKTHSALATVSVLSLFAGVLVAAAPATNPATNRPSAATDVQQVVHRVTGLFSHDREADLRTALESIPGVELVRLDFEHAEATFAYAPAKAFAGTTPEKIVERFDQMLKTASNNTMGIKPVCTTPREKLERIEIPVEGLDCKACSLAAYEVLAKQVGVEQATASFKKGLLSALIDPSKTTREKLQTVLKERGVTVKQP